MSEAPKKRGRKPSLETQVARAAVDLLHQQQKQATEPAPAQGKTTRQFRNRYDAAGMGRRMAGWNPPRTGPNTALRGLERIRERARDSTRNDSAATSSVQKWTTAIVGIGITPRFKRISNKKRRQEIADLFADFVAKADADCVLNLYGLQTLGVRTWFDAGECFVRRRNRFLDEDLPVPMQVQLLEPDMVPLFDSDARQGLPAGNIIRQGIEFNKRGKRVAYWVYKTHPGDLAFIYNGEELVRVAASEMTHIFEPKRPGQIRGVSELANILAELRNAADYKDAVLERQKLANLFVAFIKRTLPAPSAFGDVDPLNNEPISDDGTEPPPLLPMAPGLMQELDDGQDVTFANPPEAGTTYSDYIRTVGLGLSSGQGLPYELHSGDIINVSDRTLRIVMNEFRRFAEQRQWQVVIPMLCQVVIDWFVEAAVLKGDISLEEADDVRRVEHSPHGWPDIHPTQDIEGRLKAVEGGLRSRSSVIAAGGDDPDAVDEERAADKKREDALGLAPVAQGAGQTPPNTNPPSPDDEEPQQTGD